MRVVNEHANVDANAIVAEGARQGRILLSCGTYGNVVRILVPLTVSDAVLDEGLKILEGVIAQVTAPATATAA